MTPADLSIPVKFQRHAPRTFLTRIQPLLAAASEENHLLHALALRLEAGTMTLSGTPVLATVDDPEGPLLAALRVPPGNLILTTGPTEAAAALASGLRAADAALPGVTGPKAIAEAFASAWTASRELRNLVRVRACAAVAAPPAVAGELRLATEADVETIAKWVEDFGVDVFKGAGDSRRFVTRRVNERAVYVWAVEGAPRSMACVDGDTTRGVRLDWIYTPPAQRGRGFAKSCVAALTARLLAEGRRFCLAHATTSDARANALLERIGYRAVGVQASWRFKA